MRLDELAVLVIDCQSTGATPALGSLLEIGWGVARPDKGASDNDVTSLVLELPEGERIPPAVSRVTGLGSSDLAGAVSPTTAWRALAEAAAAVARVDGIAPTVIHYARFEEKFLVDLHRRFDPDAGFPFDIVCAHAIARRLLPELPRKSLRAVAGYFGFSPELLRRSKGHAAATAFAWPHLVAMLREEHVADWQALRDWLSASTPVPSRARAYPMSRDQRLAIPDAPGVYRMLRTNGDVLYVGKATSLKSRVNSYFRKRSAVGERLLEMLSQARDLDVTVTETVLEAAMLESDEIKRLAPPYNVALREDERDAWFATRDLSDARREPDELFALGPLPSRRALRSLAALAELLTVDPRTIEPGEARAALGIPVSHRLSAENIALGFDWFARTHRALLDAVDEPMCRRLLALGALLWRAHGALPRHDESDDDVPWEPGRVTSELERAVMVGAELVRRGRWLCLLSDAAVAWREPLGRPRVVVLDRGAIVERGWLDDVADLPVPPGASKSARERRQCFDVATYDRLRTLSTELKRMLADPRTLATVRLGARVVLSGAALRRAVGWQLEPGARDEPSGEEPRTGEDRHP